MPKIIVSKSAYFDAAHHLPKYDGPCSRVHGHTWKVTIAISKEVDKTTGISVDFKVLKKFLTTNVVEAFDHGDLNDSLKNPTAENLGLKIWKTLEIRGQVEGFRPEWVEIWESRDSCCRIEDW